MSLLTSPLLQGLDEDREAPQPLRGGGRSRVAGSVNLERQVEGSEGAGSVLSYNPHINLTLTQQRQRLPIFKVRRNSRSALGAYTRKNVYIMYYYTSVKFVDFFFLSFC